MSETWLKALFVLCLTTISTHSWVHDGISSDFLTLADDEDVATDNENYSIEDDGLPEPETPAITWSDIVQLAKRYYPFKVTSTSSSAASQGQGQLSKSKQRVRYRLIPGHGFMGKRSTSRVGDSPAVQGLSQHEYDKLIAEVNYLDRIYTRKLARVSELRKHLLRVWQFGF